MRETPALTAFSDTVPKMRTMNPQGESPAPGRRAEDGFQPVCQLIWVFDMAAGTTLPDEVRLAVPALGCLATGSLDGGEEWREGFINGCVGRILPDVD
jgi:hypothetical protein